MKLQERKKKIEESNINRNNKHHNISKIKYYNFLYKSLIPIFSLFSELKKCSKKHNSK